MPDGFEATATMVDWRRYTCKRVVRSSHADEIQACVETLDMLDSTKVFLLSVPGPLEKSE